MKTLLSSVKVAVLAVGGFLCSAAAQAPSDVRIALVIGNSAYPGTLALANPANDAKAMAATLKRLGFTVLEVRDVKRSGMDDAVRQFFSALKGKQGIGLLYYAGHGLQVDWRNYMVPVDAKLQSPQDVTGQTVDVNDVLDALKAAKTRMNIVILDACRDNPFPGKGGKGLAPVDAPSGTFLAYATAPGNVAEDGVAGENGLYTKHLLAELEKPTTIEGVFKRVRLAVRQASGGKQVPWESTSLEEEFSFAGSAGLPQVGLPERRAQDFAEQKTHWDRIRVSNKPEDFYEFLSRYPNGLMTEVAQARLDSLAKPTVVSQAAANEAPGAGLRNFQVGDRWKTRYQVFYRGSTKPSDEYHYQYRVERGEGDGLVVIGVADSIWVPDKRWVITPEGAVISRKQSWGESVEFNPPAAQMPATSLQVGQRFSTRVSYKSSRSDSAFDDFDVRVTGRESIESPLGTHQAYVVRRTERTYAVMLKDSVGMEYTSWYRPDMRIPLKVHLRQLTNPPVVAVEETVRVELVQ